MLLTGFSSPCCQHWGSRSPGKELLVSNDSRPEAKDRAGVSSEGTRLEFCAPLYSLLDTAAEKYPSRTAVLFQNTRISYRKLRQLAQTFAGALRRAGIQPGDRVAVMLPNLPQTVIAFWGIALCGGIVVMTNPLYMETELLGHLRDSKPKLMILLDALWKKIVPLSEQLPISTYVLTTIEDSLSFPLNLLWRLKMLRSPQPVIHYDQQVVSWKNFCRGADSWICPIADPQNTPLLIQYTGGTTGTPKGAILTHANLGVNCRQVLDSIKITDASYHTFLSVLPFFHVYGLAVGVTIPAYLAATTLTVPRYAPLDILRLIKKFRPTIFPGAPAIYGSLLQQKTLNKYDLTCIELCISGSSPLHRDVFNRFQAITGAKIIEGYGLTEASPITHLNAVDSRYPLRDGSIGRPIASTRARIVDKETGDRELPVGEIGELVIQGPQVMKGYWENQTETELALRSGWLYTGDLARVDNDGFYYIQDRKKDLVIVGGYNVYPREIDEVLTSHPGIAEAVTLGVPNALKDEILKAYVVLAPGAKLEASDVIAWCRKKLAAYKVSRAVEFRDSLPKSIVGKCLRRCLRAEEEEKLKSRGSNTSR